MEQTATENLSRINGMPAKIRDDVLWLTAQYRKLDKEHIALRQELNRIADILEDYGTEKKDSVMLTSAGQLRALLWPEPEYAEVSL